jgi:cbb3-type cytochrome oxidase subunit 3
MRQGLPPSFWLVLAGLCFVGALASWPRPQGQAAAQTAAAPLADGTAAPPQVGTAADAAPANAAADTTPRAAEVPALPDLSGLEEAPPDDGVPAAGRQVLRCVEGGRTVYRDAGGRCAEGQGEAVTLFPTRGVEAPR